MNRGSATIRERRVRVRLLHIPLPPYLQHWCFLKGYLKLIPKVCFSITH